MFHSKPGIRSLFRCGASALVLAAASVGAAAAQEVEPEATTVDEIVVTGFRASLSSALNLKRNESGVVDAIQAEDIADFPDLNLAESLQRIPGVAISRRSGEGRQVTVRGLGADYTRVRVNGMEAIATSSGTSNSGGTNRGRGFDFNIFSSDLFNSLVVRKTASAEVDEGSLGATVDLNSARPFDFREPQLVMSAAASYNDLAETVTPRIGFLASNRWADGRLGALISVSYDKRELYEHGANITRWTYGGSNGGWHPDSTVPGLTIGQINGTDPATAMYHPRIPAYVEYDTRSERLGVAGSFQAQLNTRTTLTLDALYSRFEGERFETQLQALGLSRPGVGKPEAIIRDGVVDDANNLVYAEIDNVDLRTQSSHNVLDTEFTQVTAGFTHDISDRFHINGLVGRSRSVYEDPIATIVTFERADSQGFVYDFRTRMPRIDLGFDATDPAGWSTVQGQSEVRLTPERVRNTFDTARLNGEYEVNQGLTLKAGVDWKRFNYDSIAFQRPNTSTIPILSPADIAALSRTFNFSADVPQGSTTAWLAPDLQAYIDRFDIYSGEGMWDLRVNTGSQSAVQETGVGAFVQADFHIDNWIVPIRGDVGLRYVNTEQVSSGNALAGATVEWVTNERSYDNWLPSLNLAADLTDTVVARFGMAETIARPGLGSLSPGGSVSVQGANRNFSTGNPNLDPTKSFNVDLSLEWYPEAGSILALGVFYKDISTFIQTLRTEAVYSTLGLPNSLLDGTVATPDMVFQVTRPVNSDGGELYGYEVNWQQPFNFLPGVWSNFGLLANYTYVTSDIEYQTSNVPGAPTVDATLIGLSKHAANGTIYYEDDKFSARVSVAYRGGYLMQVPGNDFNSWHGANATTTVDAQASYDIRDNLRFSIEALNLTDEYNDLYVDESNRLNVYTNTGRQFIAGLRYSF